LLLSYFTHLFALLPKPAHHLRVSLQKIRTRKCADFLLLIAQNPPCTASIYVPTVKQPTGGTFFIPHSLTESDTLAYTENSQDYRLARDKPKGVLFHVFRKQQTRRNLPRKRRILAAHDRR
jgi:hypothetical protein